MLRALPALFAGLLTPLLMPGLPVAGAAALDELSLAGDFSVELTAAWEPLTDTVYKFEQTYPLLRDLTPAEPAASHTADAFRPFLPPGPVEVGQTWPFDARAALPFLRQFHSGVTHRMHHGHASGMAAPGAWAVLRASGPRFAEVLLRVHADFLIDGSGAPETSSWLTPAQFAGRMLIDREQGTVVSFELALPDSSANVDLNMSDGSGFSADIGRFPRMELSGGSRHESSAQPVTDERLGFTGSVSVTDARTALRREFYPFASIDWLELGEALRVSKETDKPLHVIALFGSLSDESC